MTQEEFNAIALENQVATDNYNNIKNRLNKINEVAQAYANATPEQQAKARWAMEQVLTEYNTLKQQQQDAFARLNTSSDNYTRALALMNQPAPTPAQTWAWQRRRVISNPTVNPNITPSVNITPNVWVYWPGSVAPTPTVSGWSTWPSDLYNGTVGFRNGIQKWVWDNMIIPWMDASTRAANKLWLISDSDADFNRKTVRDAWNAQINDSSTKKADKNSNAYIYSNEWAQGLWDAAKYMTEFALLKPNVVTTPYSTPALTSNVGRLTSSASSATPGLTNSANYLTNMWPKLVSEWNLVNWWNYYNTLNNTINSLPYNGVRTYTQWALF